MRYEPPKLKFYQMNGESICAIAAARSVLKEQFGITRRESTLVKQVAKYIRNYTVNGIRYKGTIRDFFEDFGIGPYGIAYLLERNFNQSKRYLNETIKIFSSRNGDIDTLDALLFDYGEPIIPIFHQLVLYPEEKSYGEKPDGHYMLYGGSQGRYVWYFDVSRGEGWKRVTKSVFTRNWKNPRAGDEKWYMAAITEYHLEAIKDKSLYFPQDVKYYQSFDPDR